MKFLIASDIHGSAYYCERLIDAFRREGADRLLLLGDLLYHGPRNDLPRDYAPKRVAELLNEYKDKILAVRGNCEAEVDQMMLDFAVMADYAVIPVGERLICATHGHHYGENSPPPHKNGDVLLKGHTHNPARTEHATYLYVNPGSDSHPTNGSAHGYMTLCGARLEWKTLDGEAYMKYEL